MRITENLIGYQAGCTCGNVARDLIANWRTTFQQLDTILNHTSKAISTVKWYKKPNVWPDLLLLGATVLGMVLSIILN